MDVDVPSVCRMMNRWEDTFIGLVYTATTAYCEYRED